MNNVTTGLIAITFLFCSTIQAKTLVADAGIAAKPLQACKTDLRYLNQVLGWQVKWPRQWQGTIASSPDSINEALVRWSQVPAAINETIDTLRTNIPTKQTAPRAVVIRVHQQVRDLVEALTSKNSKYIFRETKNKNAIKWNTLIKHEIAPAVAEFEDFIHQEYMPASTADSGFSSFKGGNKCFSSAVKWWTTLNPSLAEIEAIGQKHLNESRKQLLATGKAGDTVESILADLRAQAKENGILPNELITLSESAISRAKNKSQHWFSKEINKKIAITVMPKYMQDSAPAGYYSRAQGDEPASYIINTSRSNERHLMSEVIAFHEGIPGHHLWVTYPRETPSKGYNSGILEGWALYAEYLADEIGLYSSTFDRQGMLTKHLWTASRLIVEPGLHVHGWSRDDAIHFMIKNTVMSRAEIEIEVDRYLAMPGQSLSYMLGADLILSERQRATEILGNSFDIAAFHDVILTSGVRPLPQVTKDIRIWTTNLLAD
ncbi:DUF885 domain-containing protein [Colwellia psychrerythraea]|uniref:DUF885 domain-containing protein n=1 Tax=Colwellia psychrerythraea TaxID=28229 RepID=A0A099KXS4_COLPS|nr:DUF885 domain-containing protein [Colwellia psychrerythraea]KGJ94627.1 protein of unknown function DUF885 [Colwellia psychrerythraea]